MNQSISLKFVSTEYLAESSKLLDPYLASLYASKDCDRETYRMKTLPEGVNLRNTLNLIWQCPWRKLFKISSSAKKDPQQAKLDYQELVNHDMIKFKQLKKRGPIKEEGLQTFASALFHATTSSFEHELAILLFVVLPMFKELEKKTREGETEEIRNEYSALCGGYEGDGLMQMNIEIHRLANLLPAELWEEYPHADLDKLAKRIQDNLDGAVADLPSQFLVEWRSFMERHGWDGQDQLFPSCPRYEDSPVLLLLRLRQNVGSDTINPSAIQREQVEKRRRVMALHEQREQNKTKDGINSVVCPAFKAGMPSWII
jgi:hypothetical protein